MNSKPLSLKANKILLIAMPYLGDVLLATPLLHSLRLAYPQAQLDVLVFENTVDMLTGNPDINQIITTPKRPTWAENLALYKRIFRRYDLAMAIQTGDRPFLYTLLAAPVRVNAVPAKPGKAWWKRFFVQRWTEFDNFNTHTVLQNLKLLDLIGVLKSYALVPPQAGNIQQLIEHFDFLTKNQPFVILHPLPQWQYKRWTLEGWLQICRFLDGLGLKPVLSGGPGQEEIAYLKQIAAQLPNSVVSLAGQVSLAELAYIISKAQLFIGPDTGVTHLAAATGIPVIALFGPTNPVKWAPWPIGYAQDQNPFEKVGCRQVSNITFLQGQAPCVPCHLEGCENHRLSHSACLDNLAPEQVQSAILQILSAAAATKAQH
ncbi:MAG: putative lipopolysaccharide heptosyltransferase III [Methylococcales bacterium]